MYKIYTLSLKSEPELVRYVGLTKYSLGYRLSHHKDDCKRIKSHKTNWINKHINDILITEIDSCETLEEASNLEINYIKLYKACGANLVNGTTGGQTGFTRKHSEETKRKISTARKRVFVSEEWKNNISKGNLGKHQKEVVQYDFLGNKIKEFSSINMYLFFSPRTCSAVYRLKYFFSWAVSDCMSSKRSVVVFMIPKNLTGSKDTCYNTLTLDCLVILSK